MSMTKDDLAEERANYERETITWAKKRQEEWDRYIAEEQNQVKRERIQQDNRRDAEKYMMGPGFPDGLREELLQERWPLIQDPGRRPVQLPPRELEEEDDERLPWAQTSDLVKSDQEKIQHRLNMIAGNLRDMEALNLEESKLLWELASEEIQSLVARYWRATHNLSTKRRTG